MDSNASVDVDYGRGTGRLYHTLLKQVRQKWFIICSCTNGKNKGFI